MPARNPQAVRQRTIAPARQRTGQPATPSLDPVFAALNPSALPPARDHSRAAIDAQLLEVHIRGQVAGFSVALTMDGRFQGRNEYSTTTYLLDSDDIARLITELLDATTDADPAWRDQVLGLIRSALDSNAERK
jgi:hypothetical protein